MNEHEARHIALSVTRKGLIWEAREVRLITLEKAPCGHEECRETYAESPVVARGFSAEATAHRAGKKLIQQRLQEEKYARDRAASEALGG